MKVRDRELDFWDVFWNSDDVDGWLDSGAGGDGVGRSSAGWGWCTKLKTGRDSSEHTFLTTKRRLKSEARAGTHGHMQVVRTCR